MVIGEASRSPAFGTAPHLLPLELLAAAQPSGEVYPHALSYIHSVRSISGWILLVPASHVRGSLLCEARMASSDVV